MAKKDRGPQRGKASAKKEPKAKPKKPAKKKARQRAGLVNYRHMYALSKKERVEILAVLCERVASPKEISEERNEGLSQVSYHITVLRKCGLIGLVTTEPRRGAVEHFYKAVVPSLIQPGAWDRLPPAIRRAISANIIQEFIDDASASIEAGTFDSSPGELAWMPLILDKAGVEKFGQLSRDFLDAVLELQASASKRLSKSNGRKTTKGTTATVFLASFLSARSPKDGKKASAIKRR